MRLASSTLVSGRRCFLTGPPKHHSFRYRSRDVRRFRAALLVLFLIAFTGPWAGRSHGPTRNLWELIWDALHGDTPLEIAVQVLVFAAPAALCLATLLLPASRTLVVIFRVVTLLAAVGLGIGLYKPLVRLTQRPDTRFLELWGAPLYMVALLVTMIAEFAPALNHWRRRKRAE